MHTLKRPLLLFAAQLVVMLLALHATQLIVKNTLFGQVLTLNFIIMTFVLLRGQKNLKEGLVLHAWLFSVVFPLVLVLMIYWLPGHVG